MVDIIVSVYKIVAELRNVNVLQQCNQQQRYQMQRIETRKAQDEEAPCADRSGGDTLAIAPEENETADTPEHLDAIPAIVIERMQQPVEGLGISLYDNRHAVEGEMLVMPDQHCKGSKHPQQLEAEELAVLFPAFRHVQRPQSSEYSATWKGV